MKMKVAGHQNVCAYAADEPSSYKVWDDDLKKYSRWRQHSESLGVALLIGAYLVWLHGLTDWASALLVLLGIMALFGAIKYMIDESNVNYLMHQWDLTEAVRDLRAEERISLNGDL